MQPRASDALNRRRFVARTAKLITVIDDWASPRFHKRIMVHHLGPIPFGTSVWKPSAGRGWGRYRVTNVIVGEALRKERQRETDRERKRDGGKGAKRVRNGW